MRGVGSMAEMLACGEVTAVRFPLVLADIVIAGLDVFFFQDEMCDTQTLYACGEVF